MPNKQALKDLQSRLADKLQAAKTQIAAPSWLALEAGGTNYLFPLHQSGEIFAWTDTQAVPYTQPWFIGVTNLRGALYGVVDFAGFMDSTRSTEPRTQAKLIAFNSAQDLNCVLLVERVIGFRKPDELTLATRPTPAPEFVDACYTDAQGASWQEINLQTLAHHTRFLAISSPQTPPSGEPRTP